MFDKETELASQSDHMSRAGIPQAFQLVHVVVLLCQFTHETAHHTFIFGKTRFMNEELESISIFNSYVRSIDQLARGDMQLAQELSYWIIQFGIKGIEPPADSNPFMLSVFEQIKEPLMKGRNKGMNAKKEIKSKSNGNQTEIKTKSNDDKKKNKRKNKKENNVIILSSNEDKSASTVDKKNPEIDECLEIIKSYNGGMIDGTQKRNRIYCKNLIGKLKQAPSVSSGQYSRQTTLKAVLQVISENKYHRSKITDPKKIYENLTLLFQICKEEGPQPKIEIL